MTIKEFESRIKALYTVYYYDIDSLIRQDNWFRIKITSTADKKVVLVRNMLPILHNWFFYIRREGTSYSELFDEVTNSLFKRVKLTCKGV